MIKWVTVLVDKTTKEIRHARECSSPFRDDLNKGINNITVSEPDKFIQKTFCMEGDATINAKWIREHLEDDGDPTSIPRVATNSPQKTKIARIMNEDEGNLDFDDRKLAYQQLAQEIPEANIDAKILLAKVNEIRTKRG